MNLKSFTWFTLLLFLLLISNDAKSQRMYYKAYGEKGKPVLVYIHGGPRGNSTLFEGTTAQKLADRGFYVIAYDRRGEGRSTDATAQFTFKEAIDDLNQLIAQNNLGRVSLIGHSFGGIFATFFTQQNPDRVDKLILVGALVNQQQTYDHILNAVHELAKQSGDTATLKKLDMTRGLDTASATYRKLCYELASSYGFFRMPNPTESFITLNKEYETGPFGKSNIRNDRAPLLFYQNETKVNVDNLPVLKTMVKRGQQIYAIYGADDRIFSSRQIRDIEHAVGKKRFISIGNCSHYPFVDQQEEFIKAISRFMKK